MKAKKVHYDGSASSVEKIMALVGTKGVNNTSEGRCYLPGGIYILQGETLIREGKTLFIANSQNEIMNLRHRKEINHE